MEEGQRINHSRSRFTGYVFGQLGDWHEPVLEVNTLFGSGGVVGGGTVVGFVVGTVVGLVVGTVVGGRVVGLLVVGRGVVVAIVVGLVVGGGVDGQTVLYVILNPFLKMP